MNHISVEKSLELYMYALSHLDEQHLNGSDEDLAYFALDELDGDAHTYFHSYTIDILIKANLIPIHVKLPTLTLSDIVRYLIETKNSLEEIRNDPEWKNARQIAVVIRKDVLIYQQAIELLFQFVEDERKNSGSWIFSKKNLELTITRYLEPYEKSANYPLPKSIIFTRIQLDKLGITNNNTGFLTEWSAIAATGIKTERIDLDDIPRYDRYLLVCLKDGKIRQYELGNIDHFRGLLGHNIELYKLEHNANISSPE